MTSALLAIKSQFEKANQFADIFGPILASDVKERKALLKKQYSTLAKMTHPDHAEAADVPIATAVFAELSSLYRRALKSLQNGVYEQSFTGGSNTRVTIKTGTTEYQLNLTPFREGDFSNIHLGEASDGGKVFAKIAADPTQNPYLVGEANLLARAIKEMAGGKILTFLPRFLDSVVLTSRGTSSIGSTSTSTSLVMYLSLKYVRCTKKDFLLRMQPGSGAEY